MDDHNFDDLLKKKLRDYQVPGFDPSALAALHQQLDATQLSPWYSRYRSELWIGSCAAALFAIMILWSPVLNTSKEKERIEEIKTLVKTQQEQIQKLQQEVIRLTEFRKADYSLNNSQMLRIDSLENMILTLKQHQAVRSLADGKSIEKASGILFNHWTFPIISSYQTPVVPIRRNKQSINTISTTPIKQPSEERQLTVNLMRDLEIHYHPGIGIRVGPTIEASMGKYKAGSGRIDVAVGLLADFILSPSFSLETGGKYIHRFYEITDKMELPGISLPNSSSEFGPLVSADVDSWILEIALNLKYRYPVSMKTHVLAGLGYSSLIFTKQVFEYDYSIEGTSARINTNHDFLKSAVYPGMINLSLGFSNQLKNKKIIETSVYYQYGLGAIGMEKMKTSFWGIRSAYLIPIR